jgi:hypothetical protein
MLYCTPSWELIEEDRIITIRTRTVVMLLAAIGVLLLGMLTCSISASQILARRPQATGTATRTPRPTWTRSARGIAVASPTLDATRFPDLAAAAALNETPTTTPQVLVAGSAQGLVVPAPNNGTNGAQSVQTVVVILVTATPPPPATPRPAGPTFTPGPTPTPGPPTATPLPTVTPPPPVVVHVKVDKANVRQGPGNGYLPVTQLDVNTTVTVVGRNRAGDWWKICCVNNSDVWIADAVVTVEGPIWTVQEITDVPPPPTMTPTLEPSPTPTLTPTYAWTFHLETAPQQFPLDQNYFKVVGVIYNGYTPLWGYKLKIRKFSTGQEWLTSGSAAAYDCERLFFPLRIQCFGPDLKYNVKWDSNAIQVPIGDDTWEVTVTDGAGNPLSAPVRLNTTVVNAKWYYLTFTQQ